MRRATALICLFAPVQLGCGLMLDLEPPEEAPAFDAGALDAGERDAGRRDAGPGDAGECVPDREVCNERDDDCDGLTDEDFDLRVDPLHCGGCDRACPSEGGAAGCQGGACSLVCDLGRADCDGDLSNGCEADLSDASTCGDCDTACAPSATCESGTCVVPCPADQISCGGECVDVASDERHCGGCGAPCFSDPHGAIRCESGSCVVDSCGDWHDDCNRDPSDGCETYILTDTDCGACGVACGAGAFCAGGACAAT